MQQDCSGPPIEKSSKNSEGLLGHSSVFLYGPRFGYWAEANQFSMDLARRFVPGTDMDEQSKFVSEVTEESVKYGMMHLSWRAQYG